VKSLKKLIVVLYLCLVMTNYNSGNANVLSTEVQIETDNEIDSIMDLLNINP